MKRQRVFSYLSWLLLGTSPCVFVGASYAQEALPTDVPPAALDSGFAAETVDAQEPEALLSGPMHEAFAEPVQVEIEPSIIIPNPPPEPIEELVPEIRPEDEGAIWLSGYWAWEPEREDFIWVSGVWRVPPPGREWVPGYWAEAEGGYQWVSGFWTAAERREVEYLPPPPESLETGPSSPQPDEEYSWVPGCWEYNDARYVWRPGYWTPYYSQWVWVPAHYSWTPSGVVFINGYWDYTLINRGYLFSPVYVPSTYYATQPYYYRPRVLVNLSRMLVHMFVYPRYRHYYYGDYYAPYYRDRGFYSWTNYYQRSYDPLLSYYQWYYRGRGINYVDRLNRWNNYYVRNEAFRPPRTYKQWNRMLREGNRDRADMYRYLARDARRVMDDPDLARKFRRISREQQQQIARVSRERRDIVKTRVEIETKQKIDMSQRVKVRGDDNNVVVTPTGRLKLPENSQFRELARNQRREAPPVPNRDRDNRDRDNRDRDNRDRDNRDRDSERRTAEAGRNPNRNQERREVLRAEAGDDNRNRNAEREERTRDLQRAARAENDRRNAENRAEDRDTDAARNRDDRQRMDRDQQRRELGTAPDNSRRNLEDAERRNLENAARRNAERRDNEEAERRNAERRNVERSNAERRDAERRNVERLNAERLNAERRNAERRDVERINAERLNAARNAERINAERRNAQRRSVERIEVPNIDRGRREFNAPERSQNVPRNFDRPNVERSNRDFRGGPSFENRSRPDRGNDRGNRGNDRPDRGGGNRRAELGNMDRGSPVSIERPQPQRDERNASRGRNENRGNENRGNENRGRGDERTRRNSDDKD